MDFDEVLRRSKEYIFEMDKEANRERLRDALKEQERTRREDNPFKKLQGTYEVPVLVNIDTLNKVKGLQDRMGDLLKKHYPDAVLFFKPNDRKAVYVFEEGRESRKKMGRLMKDLPKEDQKELHRLMTMFPKEGAGDKTRIVISIDPVDILRKSSSRSWAHQSCERIGASYDEGSFSDIANNNAIAYLYVGDNKEPAARYMLRWCEVDGKVDVGIEPTMYPHGQPYAFSFYDALTDILKKHGFGNYDECRTPYVYGGYSDQMGGGNEKIVYKRPGKSNLVEYARDENISLNVARALLHAGPEVRAALAENEGVCKYHSERDNVVQRILNEETDSTVLYHILEGCRPKLSCKQAERLSQVNDGSVREGVARNRTIPEECGCDIFERLSRDEEFGVRAGVAYNSIPEECGCEILDRLSRDDYWHARAGVASNESVPKKCGCDIFERLSREEIPLVREGVAGNSSIPEECGCDIFERLSLDESLGVREGVARNSSIPEECRCNIFDRLSQDVVADMRSGVAYNLIPEECGCEILDRLSRDKMSYVRRGVAVSQSIPEECGCEILDRLSRDEEVGVRERVAKNPSIPEECGCDIFERLSRDNAPAVRQVVASNQSIPEECGCDIFERLSRDEEYEMRERVAENPSVPKKCGCDIFERLSRDEIPLVREHVAGNPSIPEECGCEILDRLSREEDYEESIFLFSMREGVASNPSIPEECRYEILDRLSRDEKAYVRNAVFKNRLYWLLKVGRSV